MPQQISQNGIEQVVRIVEEMARLLVDHPEQVKARVRKGEETVLIELAVAPGEAGQVIGVRGRLARSIRILLGAYSMRMKCRLKFSVLQ